MNDAPPPPNPHEIAENRVILAEEYSRLCDEYGALEQESIKHFVLHREEFKSDTSCERSFLVTEKGQRWLYLKNHLKGIEKRLSASNTLLRHYENQGKNLY